MAKGIVVALALGAAFFLFFRWFEAANLYHPDRVLSVIPGSYGLKADELALRTDDGETLHGWFVPSSSGTATAVLIFHGNAGNVSTRMPKLKMFHDMGHAVLLFDYRGYGRSTGSPSEQGTYRDAAAAVSELERRGFSPARTAYYGESLGCAVALETAVRRPPGALILDSAFTSAVDMANLLFPRLPARLLMRYPHDNLSKIGRLKCPLLSIHSPNDDIVPFWMGRKLFDAAPPPKKFFQSRGDHNEGFLETPGFKPAMEAFLKETLK